MFKWLWSKLWLPTEPERPHIPGPFVKIMEPVLKKAIKSHYTTIHNIEEKDEEKINRPTARSSQPIHVSNDPLTGFMSGFVQAQLRQKIAEQERREEIELVKEAMKEHEEDMFFGVVDDSRDVEDEE